MRKLAMLFLALWIPVITSADDWHFETKDSSPQCGLYNAAAVDTKGYLHIISNDELTRSLEYRFEDASGWNTEILVTLDRRSISALSIVLDSSGHPHICYGRFDEVIVSCSHWNGAAWDHELIGYDFSMNYRIGLGIDASDRLHVSYIAWEPCVVKYYEQTAIGWNLEVVDGLENSIYGTDTSLFLDDNDMPHIVYNTHFAKGHIKYALKDAMGWHSDFIDKESANGNYLSLSFQGADPVVCYPDLSNYDLKFAKRTGNSWQTEIVDDEEVGQYLCVVVDNQNRVRIIYRDERNKDIKIATQTATGWDLERPFRGLKASIHGLRWILTIIRTLPIRAGVRRISSWHI